MQECLVTDNTTCLFIPTNLTANVVDATAAQAPVDFGNVPINTSVTKSIPVLIDAGYLITGVVVNDAFNPPFTFDFGNCGTSAGTGPGSCNVDETFAPTAPVNESVALTMQECLVTDNTSCLFLPIPITANGVSEGSAIGDSIRSRLHSGARATRRGRRVSFDLPATLTHSTLTLTGSRGAAAETPAIPTVDVWPVDCCRGGPMRRLALLMAMLLPMSGSLSGCSWIFVQPLPPRYERADSIACTTNRAAPVVDTILTVTNVTSAVYVAGENNVANKGAAVSLGLLVGAMWFSSAIYGYTKTSECEAALEDDESAQYSHPRLHLRSPPPGVGGPTGMPADRPPAWDAPTVVVPSVPPAAPAPAAQVPQPRDDDAPGAPTRQAPPAPQQVDPE